jgi:hypothetical protein
MITPHVAVKSAVTAFDEEFVRTLREYTDPQDEDEKAEDSKFWCEVLVAIGLFDRVSDQYAPTDRLHIIMLERSLRY